MIAVLVLIRRLMAFGCTASFAISAFGVTDEHDARRELGGAWQRLLPVSGSVHVHFEEAGTRARLLAGFDFESGAYYKAFATHVGGRQTDRARYDGRPVAGQVHILEHQEVNVGDNTLDQFIPLIVAWDFLKRPDLAVDIVSEDNGFVVQMTRPRGIRYEPGPMPASELAPKTVLYHFDKLGRLVSAENYCGSGQTMEWSYEDPTVGNRGIASIVSMGTRRLIDFRFDAKTNPVDFSAQSVESLSVAAGLIESDQPLWFGRQIDSLKASTRPTEPKAVSTAEAKLLQPTGVSRTTPARWYLIGGGVAVVVAGIALKRRFG